MYSTTKIQKTNLSAVEALKFEEYVGKLAAGNDVFVRSIRRGQGPRGFSTSFSIEGDDQAIMMLQSALASGAKQNSARLDA